jgi:hypothetical protein
MAFAAWYSFRKFLPDCKVFVEVDLVHPLFRWASVFGALGRPPRADFRFHPAVVAVRDFEGDWSAASAKSEDQKFLVDYSGGCGNFVADEWINRNQVPFHRATKRFGTLDMTVNEVAVLRAWEKCNDLYRSVGV